MDASSYRSLNHRFPRLTVVIVNYNGWSDVVPLVESLQQEPEFLSGACRITVVDNASLGPIPDSQALHRPGLQLVLRPDNGGFAVGVNAGWRESKSPWLLLLNPDVEIEAGIVGRILARLDALDARPEGPPGVVGFGLRNPDGSPQGSVGIFPSLTRFLREQFLPRSRRKYQPDRRARPGPVDWVTGACMLINAKMTTELGGMDEDFFLYHEEVAFCRVARNRGWGIEYDPSVSVIHRHPLQDRPVSPKMRVIIRHSKLLYFRKHTPRWQFLALARVIAIEAAVKGAWAVLRKQPVERRAWKAIGRISEQLRHGQGPRGRQVLTLAEEAERGPKEPTDPGEGTGPRAWTSQRRRSPRATRV